MLLPALISISVGIGISAQSVKDAYSAQKDSFSHKESALYTENLSNNGLSVKSIADSNKIATKELKSSADSLITPEGVTPCDSIPVIFPSSLYTVGGKDVYLSVLVDLNKNVLYSYDSLG